MTKPWQQAAEVLREGGVVATPTDTVWGLLAHPGRPEAIERIYAIKGRAKDKPLQLLVADLEGAKRLVRPKAWPSLERLARRFWPGRLTIVAPAAAMLGPALTPAGRVGLRLPAHEELRRLIAELGGMLAATSANPSGEPPVRDPLAAARLDVDHVVPGEAGGLASTVFDLEARRLIRGGPIALEALLEALSD